VRYTLYRRRLHVCRRPGLFGQFHNALEHAVWLLLTAGAELPNMTFWADDQEMPLERRGSAGPRLVLRCSRLLSARPGTLLLPLWEQLLDWNRRNADEVAARRQAFLPYAQLEPRLYWRGSTMQHWRHPEESARQPRFILVRMSAEYPELIDARFTRFMPWVDEETRSSLLQAGLVAEWEDGYESALRSRYLIDVEGVTMSKRLHWLLLAPGVVFRQVSMAEDWMARSLQPWVHYIPVREDLGDLIDRLRWAEAHADECARISQAATHLALERFGRQHTLAALFRALVAYHRVEQGSQARDAQAGGDALSEVRSRLVEPSALPYAFTHQSYEDHLAGVGRGAQSLAVDALFRGARHLFAVEAGAHDGEYISNTLFLELARGWQCLLVEANPELQERLLSKRRRSHLLLGGLSITRESGHFRFAKRGMVGGIADELSPDSARSWRALMREAQRLRRLPGRAAWWNETGRDQLRGRGGFVTVPCFPLHLALRALRRPVVDYWSLDTEGSEGAILESTDFGEFELGLLTVEHNNEEHRIRRVRPVVESRGFVLLADIGIDFYFYAPSYFERRGLPAPSCDTIRKAVDASLIRYCSS